MNINENKILLEELYITKQLSMSSIGVMYSVSAPMVRSWLIKHNIPTRPSTKTIYRELKETPFSNSQKDLIIGCVLGDGSLSIGKDCKNARFIIRHGLRQKDYLIWKRDKLKPFTKSKVGESSSGKHIISGVECNVDKSYVFSTISHPWLTELRKLFYPNNIKVIPNNLSDILNNLSIAVWICDDGCFTYSKKFGVYRLDLHTESFTHKENIFICRILSERFNAGFRINSRFYDSGKAYYICLSGKDVLRNLVKNIYSFVPECMSYKFKYYI